METGLTPIFLKTGERDVLNNIMLGLTDRQIAEKIHMSLGCIKDRKRRLFDRFEVNNAKELIVKYNNYLLKIKEIEEIRKKLVGGI
ncbi:MAG: response regulator transcription factor [Alphaproteobacteria bacterium]|nr:response regulator transcription factor [Alphaproteobacteria bacterium]